MNELALFAGAGGGLLIIREVQPDTVFLENVPGLLFNPYFRTILADLQEVGYNIPWPVLLAAEDVGAPHRRERIWFVAHTNKGQRRQGSCKQPQRRKYCSGRETDVGHTKIHRWKSRRESNAAEVQRRRELDRGGCGQEFSDPILKRLEVQQCKSGNNEQEQPAIERNSDAGRWWTFEPGMGRVVNGLAHILDFISTTTKGAF